MRQKRAAKRKVAARRENWFCEERDERGRQCFRLIMRALKLDCYIHIGGGHFLGTLGDVEHKSLWCEGFVEFK